MIWTSRVAHRVKLYMNTNFVRKSQGKNPHWNLLWKYMTPLKWILEKQGIKLWTGFNWILMAQPTGEGWWQASRSTWSVQKETELVK
jgi:hypothetical protein